MAKPRMAEASAPWRTNSPDDITLGSGSGSGSEYSGRSWRWRCPWGPSVASPLASCHLSSRRLPRPQSPASAASGAQWLPPHPATSKRVVLLPHAQMEPTNTPKSLVPCKWCAGAGSPTGAMLDCETVDGVK
jgi:hypothetical protein